MHASCGGGNGGGYRGRSQPIFVHSLLTFLNDVVKVVKKYEMCNFVRLRAQFLGDIAYKLIYYCMGVHMRAWECICVHGSACCGPIFFRQKTIERM